MQKKSLISLGAAALLSVGFISTAYADSLSSQKSQLTQKQKETAQLQSQINQTKSQIDSQKQKTKSLQSDLQKTQATLSHLQQNITQNLQSQTQLQNQIVMLNQQIEDTQQQYSQDMAQLQDIVRNTYENGNTPYIAVILGSTSISDFMSRFYLMTCLAEAQTKTIREVRNAKIQLQSKQNQQDVAIQTLKEKETQLHSMQAQELQLKNQKQHSIQNISTSIKGLQTQENAFSQKMHLTQQQIKQLKSQIAEQEAIMATKSGNVVETDLQYHAIPPQKLYDFVQQYDTRNIGYPSDFTLADMQTICQAGQNYNVNPILLVAITGAEESFVPTQYPRYSYWAGDAKYIHNNPFNVYYSWMWTEMNRPDWTLSTTANIAANTVRHKLSTTPRYGDTVFQWLNDARNPWGLYATDPAWSSHVQYFYQAITSYVSS